MFDQQNPLSGGNFKGGLRSNMDIYSLSLVARRATSRPLAARRSASSVAFKAFSGLLSVKGLSLAADRPSALPPR